MTTASDLADELERLFYRADDVAHGDAPALIQRFFDDRGNQILSALRRVDVMEKALKPFAEIVPSSLYPDDGSEGEEYIVTLRGLYSNPLAFTGKDLALARQALTGEA